MELPLRSKTELSGGTIKWDYHLEAVTEVSGGTINWIYHFEVRAEVSDRTIRWEYLSKVKQRYQVELSGGIIICKQWGRNQVGQSCGTNICM